MTLLIVGCPVRDRAWIIDDWIGHVSTAVGVASDALDRQIDLQFFFVGDPVTDPETFVQVDRLGDQATVVRVAEEGLPVQHAWHFQRYAYMAGLRNKLLGAVRELEPDLFWSVDSDILIAPRSLELALQALEDPREFAAVGQRCYMAPGDWCTSNAMLTPHGGMVRETVEGLIQVDAIMAAKLMTPAAYQVDYETHQQGEDIGWSINVRRRGLKLGWDGRTTSNHVMVRPVPC